MQEGLDLQPQRQTLRFEPVPHRYFLEPEHIELPSVTTVLKETRMVDYSMIPQDVLVAASKRGTVVHEALALWLNDDLDEASLDPMIAGYVQAGMRFVREARLQPLQVETRVWSPAYRYAGTFDLTAGMPDGTEAVIDWKTGLLMPGHRLQLAAYTGTQDAPRKWRRMAVKLNVDGTYAINEYPQADFRRDFDQFAHALSCCWWQRTDGKIQPLEEAA